jgi:hypothetical protein
MEQYQIGICREKRRKCRRTCGSSRFWNRKRRPRQNRALLVRKARLVKTLVLRLKVPHHKRSARRLKMMTLTALARSLNPLTKTSNLPILLEGLTRT